MRYEITICLIKKDEICSIDDTILTHATIELEKGKEIACMNEITKVLEKYEEIYRSC